MKFTRITIEPDKMGGMPCIRGLRILVATIVGMVADGMSEKEILKAYPDLEAEDIRQALKYAAEAVRESAPTGKHSMRFLINNPFLPRIPSSSTGGGTC